MEVKREMLSLNIYLGIVQGQSSLICKFMEDSSLGSFESVFQVMKEANEQLLQFLGEFGGKLLLKGPCESLENGGLATIVERYFQTLSCCLNPAKSYLGLASTREICRQTCEQSEVQIGWQLY